MSAPQPPADPRAATRDQLFRPLSGGPAEVWERWSSRAAPWARVLALTGMGFLFLDAAATFQVIYTIRVSYVLFATACVVGAPVVVAGWLRLAPALRWLAVFLLLTYLTAALTGQAETLASQARGGEQRELVYLSDLALGLALIGLVSGLWPGERALRPALVALTIGACIAATYAIYQLIAQRFGWPLTDVNNALNTNGAPGGTDLAVGPSVLGWERVRGTFTEPQFLAGYLAMLFPIVVAVAIVLRRTRRGTFLAWLLLAAAGVVAAAILATTSLPAWLTLLIGMLVSLTLLSVGRGWPSRAFVAAVATICVLMLVPLTLFSPQTVSPLAGRTLEYTAAFRTDSWAAAVRTWSSRPVLGYGPGQSSVRIAKTGGLARPSPTQTGPLLGSAQGVWAAALVDAGVFGLGAWLLFIGAALVIGASALLRRPTVLMACLFSAGLVAVLGTLVSGDRLELRVCVVLGLLLAAVGSASGGAGQAEAGHTDQQAEGSSG